MDPFAGHPNELRRAASNGEEDPALGGGVGTGVEGEGAAEELVHGPVGTLACARTVPAGLALLANVGSGVAAHGTDVGRCGLHGCGECN